MSCSCSPTEEAIALEAMRWRYLLRRRYANKSSQEYQISGCGVAWFALLFWEQAVVGSNPTTRTRRSLAERICSRLLSGEIQVQPLGDRPNLTWAFGRTVMHLILNQTDTGSTPVALTKTPL